MLARVDSPTEQAELPAGASLSSVVNQVAAALEAKVAAARLPVAKAAVDWAVLRPGETQDPEEPASWSCLGCCLKPGSTVT
jgi:hypothetical protein